MIVYSPAKINWFLYVLRKRDDGFHDIVSPVHKVTLCDSLFFDLSEGIHLFDEKIIDDNIVLKTVKVLQRYRPECKAGVSIKLNKNIPLAAGLGGGSSDAASTLIALNQLWALGLSRGEMIAIASEIGSDVPLFLGNSFSVISGRGEKLRSYEIDQQFDILLVNPGIKISAKWAYENTTYHFDTENYDIAVDTFLSAMGIRDYAVMREYMINNLEVAAFNKFPQIKEIKDKLKREGARVSLMSGSGSTVFGVFEETEEAEKVRINFNGIWTAVVKTLQ